MSLITCNVICNVYDDTGLPVVGAVIVAKLNRYEVYQGYVIPAEVTGTTDGDGAVTLALWPNALGSTESMYAVKITNPNGKTLKINAVVPDVATAYLHDIAELPAYEGKTDGQLILTDAVQAGATAISKALDAENSAARALASEQGAAASEAASLAARSGAETARAGVEASEAVAIAKATESANSAAAAASSMAAAGQSATEASNDRASVAALLATFRGIMLGVFASDAQAIAFAAANNITVSDGTMYENTTGTPNKFRIFNGAEWNDYDASAQALQSAAALSAASASNSETVAIQKAGLATEKAEAADLSATASANSALAAHQSEVAASGSESASAGSAVAADLSAQAAAGSEGRVAADAASAAASESLAHDWATKTDAEVVAGQGYGAKKYAIDAAASEAQALLYKNWVYNNGNLAMQYMQEASIKATAASFSAGQADSYSYQAGQFKSETEALKNTAAAAALAAEQSAAGLSAALQTIDTKFDKTGGTLTGGLKEARVEISYNDIDLNTGNYFTKTISGATTLTLSNVPDAGTAASFILDLTNGGSATITWWSGMKWAGGTAPTLTASGRDVLGFFTHDGGTTWTGLVLGKDVK